MVEILACFLNQATCILLNMLRNGSFVYKWKGCLFWKMWVLSGRKFVQAASNINDYILPLSLSWDSDKSSIPQSVPMTFNRNVRHGLEFLKYFQPVVWIKLNSCQVPYCSWVSFKDIGKSGVGKEWWWQQWSCLSMGPLTVGPWQSLTWACDFEIG